MLVAHENHGSFVKRPKNGYQFHSQASCSTFTPSVLGAEVTIPASVLRLTSVGFMGSLTAAEKRESSWSRIDAKGEGETNEADESMFDVGLSQGLEDVAEPATAPDNEKAFASV